MRNDHGVFAVSDADKKMAKKSNREKTQSMHCIKIVFLREIQVIVRQSISKTKPGKAA